VAGDPLKSVPAKMANVMVSCGSQAPNDHKDQTLCELSTEREQTIERTQLRRSIAKLPKSFVRRLWGKPTKKTKPISMAIQLNRLMESTKTEYRFVPDIPRHMRKALLSIYYLKL
jgi:hypothetical protein